MREILLVSRWFYPGGASLLEWLAGFAATALLAVIVSRALTGTAKAIVAAAGLLLCAAGALVCAAMIAAEVLVLQLSDPPAAAAYAVVGIGFGCLFSQLRSGRPNGTNGAKSVALVTVALAYLFVYGTVPSIVELPAGSLREVQGANVLGNRPGTLAITEFADFECPPCAVQDEIMDKIWTTYSDRITYSFRHFPKPRHPHALPAAIASQCAADSGAFWETKRLLFSNQERLSEFLALPHLPTIPVPETTSFAQCVQARSTNEIVERDREAAAALGLKVTPSILVGNKLIQGVTRYPRLALIVERELREQGTSIARQTSVRVPSGCGAAQACSQ